MYFPLFSIINCFHHLGFNVPVVECAAPLGMKSKTISDQAITASSIFDQYHGPERTRLDIVKEGLFSGGWMPSYLNLGQWIQVDLTNITKITGVATQGLQELDNWVTKYSITFSVDEGPFLSYNENQVP